MATNEKKLDTFRNLVLISLILYVVGLITSVIRIRSFGLTVVSYTFSDLVDEGYVDGAMMIPFYLGIVAALIAIITVNKEEPYFKISSFLSAILPIITLFTLVDAKNQIEKDVGLDDEFGFVVSGSYDLGALAIALGVVLSFIAAIKYNTDEDQEPKLTKSSRNAMLDPRYPPPKSINSYQYPTPLQNHQSEHKEDLGVKQFSKKFCSNCGSAIVEGNLFCMTCGEKVEN